MFRLKTQLAIAGLISIFSISAAQRPDENRKKAYMDISSIVVSDPDHPGAEMYASDLRKLLFTCKYSGLTGSRVKVHLLYRLLMPDGSMLYLSDMDAYSDEIDFSVQPQKNRTAGLTSIDNPTQKPFRPGTYTFELWFEGRMIWKEYFELMKKPEEATFIDVGTPFPEMEKSPHFWSKPMAHPGELSRFLNGVRK